MVVFKAMHKFPAQKSEQPHDFWFRNCMPKKWLPKFEGLNHSKNEKQFFQKLNGSGIEGLVFECSMYM
jgi:hypothetical protein